MGIKRLYIAGPLFCEAERSYNRHIRDELAKHGYEALLPQDNSADIPEGPMPPDEGLEVSRKVFRKDLEMLDSCDALVLNLDGRVPDEGACVELGYAYARGMPCFGLKTDIRTAEYGMDNMMITGALDGGIARSVEELVSLIGCFRRGG
jgi:nucleoside 2-deoxyribosyltransferase